MHGRKASAPPLRGSSRLDKLRRDDTGKRGTISTNSTSSLHGTLLDAVFPQSKDRAQAITRDAILIGCAVVLMTIASQISIPWHPVPLTGGTFGALLVGGLLGLRRAAIALVIYLAIGALGAGVFADWNGGWDYFTGSTGGYLVGYLVAALFVGFFADRGATQHVMTMVGVLLIANALIYAFGVPVARQLDAAGRRRAARLERGLRVRRPALRAGRHRQAVPGGLPAAGRLGAAAAVRRPGPRRRGPVAVRRRSAARRVSGRAADRAPAVG